MKKMMAVSTIAVSLLCIWNTTVFADTEDIDDSVLGLYKDQGYTNEYFEYQVDLPGEFTLEPRGVLLSLDSEQTIEDSNKESTISYLKSMLNLSSATVFEAGSSTDSITITIESPGILKDVWDEESVIAENSAGTIASSLQEKSQEEGATVTDIDTNVMYLDDFAGDGHYVIQYVYTWNGTPLYGAIVLMRSSDSKFLNEVVIETTDSSRMETICDYFSEL